MVAVFLGGGRGWDILPSQIWFLLKMLPILIFMVWTRASWPRLRIDQVLSLAWKGLIILAFINIVVSAILTFIWPDPTTTDLWKMAGINMLVLIASVWAVGSLLGPGSAPTARFARGEAPPTPRPAGDPAGGAD